MPDTIYHIIIKKEYAEASFEKLNQEFVIEILEDTTPNWQKLESLQRLKKMKDYPETTISQEAFFNALEND